MIIPTQSGIYDFVLMNVHKYMNSSDRVYAQHLVEEKKTCQQKTLPVSQYALSTFMAVLCFSFLNYFRSVFRCVA